MESITESQKNKNELPKSKLLSLKSQLELSNQKFKYKKQYLRLDSFQKNNDASETTRISRIDSNNTNILSLSTPANKRHKWRVSFAPKYRFINYIYYNPNDIIFKEATKSENKGIIKEEKEEEKESVKNRQKIEELDKVNFHCSCSLM